MRPSSGDPPPLPSPARGGGEVGELARKFPPPLRGGATVEGGADTRSSGDELVPFLDHVLVLVHDRVPAGDAAHALGEGAAVALGAGLLHDLAERVLDVALGRLALEPVAPFIGAHEVLRGLRHGAVIALPHEEAADPAREIPVDVL